MGQDVMNGLNPGQMVIKIVNEELVNLMGSETTELPIKPGNDITVLMMAGLQGAGKTTTVAKLAVSYTHLPNSGKDTANDKGVHREVESEGSRMANFWSDE